MSVKMILFRTALLSVLGSLMMVQGAQAADGWSGSSIGDPGIPFTSVAPVAAAIDSVNAQNAVKATSADSATTSGYATSAGTASQLGTLTCPAGYALTLMGGSPLCVNSVANATTAGTAGEALYAIDAQKAADATNAQNAQSAVSANTANSAGYASNADTVDGKHASELGSSGGGGMTNASCTWLGNVYGHGQIWTGMCMGDWHTVQCDNGTIRCLR